MLVKGVQDESSSSQISYHDILHKRMSFCLNLLSTIRSKGSRRKDTVVFPLIGL